MKRASGVAPRAQTFTVALDNPQKSANSVASYRSRKKVVPGTSCFPSIFTYVLAQKLSAMPAFSSFLGNSAPPTNLKYAVNMRRGARSAQGCVYCTGLVWGCPVTLYCGIDLGVGVGGVCHNQSLT